MPIRQKGQLLAAQFIPQVLANAATTFVDSLKLSSVSEKVRRGRQVVLKHRQIYGDQLADLANLYFRMSNIPIRFWSKAEDWRRWEVKCFHMLNGDRFRVYPSGAKTVCTDKLPGENLWEHMNRRALTRPMLQAAGRELFRAHQLWSDEFGSRWSHGDATMTNVIYNEKTGRARLIDFEIVHHKSLPATARHADDLLVFLLDILAIASSRKWLPFALCFLNAHGDADVIAELKDRPARPLSRHSNQTSTPEAARFNQLPGNESRNAKGEFAHSCDQRQGEGRIPGDAEKVAYEKITAFLDAQTSRNRKR